MSKAKKGKFNKSGSGQKSLFNSQRSPAGGAKKMNMKEMQDDAWVKGMTATSVNSKANCDHRGQVKIVTLQRGITLAGAKGASIDYDQADFVLDLAGGTRAAFESGGKMVLKGTQSWLDKLLPTVTHPDTIFIDWPDYGIPRVKNKFWTKLLEVLPDNTRVVVACIGSHGRTGTALANLIAASAAASEKPLTDVTSVIKLVRDRHCSHAIESEAQEDYLARAVAEYLKPGDAAEVSRQYGLLDAYRKERKAAKAASTVSVDAASTEGTTKKAPILLPAGVQDVRIKQTKTANGTTIKRGPDGIYTGPELTDLTGFYTDAGGNVVDMDGQMLIAKRNLTPGEQELSAKLPSWGEFIEKQYAPKAGA